MTAPVQEPTPRPGTPPALHSIQPTAQGANYSLARLGPVCDLEQYGVKHPRFPAPVMGKVFLKDILNLTAMEISFGVMPAQAAMPFLHKHRNNEEVYLIIQGCGQMQIDGDVLDVEAGTAIRVAPDGVRTWRNTSNENLFYIVIQAKENSLTHWTLSDGIGISNPVEWPQTA